MSRDLTAEPLNSQGRRRLTSWPVHTSSSDPSRKEQWAFSATFADAGGARRSAHLHASEDARVGTAGGLSLDTGAAAEEFHLHLPSAGPPSSLSGASEGHGGRQLPGETWEQEHGVPGPASAPHTMASEAAGRCPAGGQAPPRAWREGSVLGSGALAPHVAEGPAELGGQEDRVPAVSFWSLHSQAGAPTLGDLETPVIGL